MAKKLNKKVAIIGIVLLVMIIGACVSYFVLKQIRQDPNRALKLHEKALTENDYLEAEKQLGLAYQFAKTDEDIIQRLFELADFHLVQNDHHEAQWNKAVRCWNEVVKIDPKNAKALKGLLDYYYLVADTGTFQAWRNVNEHASELIDILSSQGKEPEVTVLAAQAKALLTIVSRGETTTPRELLVQSIELLTQLNEKEPQNPEFYELLAQAQTVEGELDMLDGIINAKENARQKAIATLESSVERSDEKATAVANLMLYKLQTAQVNDPNAVQAIRNELENRVKEVTPNDRLWFVVSVAYEIPGQSGSRSELNRAIEAVRRAHEMDPENFEYILRLSNLLYRKGNAFDDPAAKADALQIAEDALLMDAVQETTGPLRSRNFNYRFALINYLAELYLTEAITARETDNSEQAQMYAQKAKPLVDEIATTIGSTDNPTVQKFQGLLALAQDQQEKGIRLLDRAYKQNRALDKTDELSNVEGLVAMVLAKEAGRKNQIGLQAELQQIAFRSRDRFVLQQPGIYLDFAEVLNTMRNFRNWASIVEQLVLEYQSRYGKNQKTQKLLIEAALGSGQIEKAKNYLESFTGAAEDKLGYELNMVIRQIAILKQTIANLKADDKEPTADQVQELEMLRQQRDTLLPKTLASGSKTLDSNLFSLTCRDLIENGKISQAVDHLNAYLETYPESVNFLLIRLQAQQEDPMNLSAEKMVELRYQAIDLLEDLKQKALLKAELYRQEKNYDKALDVLEQDLQIDSENDWDIVQARYEILLESESFEAAEALLQKIRSENIDLCEGSLAAARLEIVRENYAQALRRLDEVIALRPLLSHAHLLKSRVHFELGEMENAIESARTTIQMNPLNAVYAKNLASLLFARNNALGNKKTIQQENEAQQAILMANQLNPTDTQLQSVFAESIQGQEPDRALAIRQQLLENNPTLTNALMLGNMAMRMAGAELDSVKKSGLLELAGKAFERGMEIDPENEILLQTYADYQQKTGKGEDPINWFKGDKNLEWKFYLRHGQYEKAETILLELFQNNPDDSLLLRGLISVYQGTGERDQVKQYLHLLSELDLTQETELWMLQKYMDMGFAEEAETHLASFKERYPDDNTALLIEAWTTMGKGRLDEALTLTNRYLETNANNSGAWRLRGRLYRLMNQPRKAIDDLQRSKSISDSPEVRMELASVYVALNQETAAFGELISGLDDPQTPLRAMLALEALYLRYNRNTDLEKMYQSMIEKNSQNPFWYFKAGLYYYNQENFVRAQDLLKTSLDLHRQQGTVDISSVRTYLDSLLKGQEYDKVLSTASDLIDSPAGPLAYMYMALVQYEQNKKSASIDSYYMALEKADTNNSMQQIILMNMLDTVGEDTVSRWISSKLEENSRSLAAHQLASALAQWKGSYNKAIEQMEKCIEILGEGNPAFINYELNKINLLIMAYIKTSDQQYLERAISLNEELLKSQPNNASLLNNMAYLLADNNQQLEQALEYARRAHQSDPGNPVFLDTYGYTQYKNGQYEKAKENLLWAIQVYEASGKAVPWDLYKHLAMAHEGLEESEEALDMYQNAIGASQQIPVKEKQQLEEAISRLQQL